MDGFIDIDKIDEVLRGRVRLGIMAYLTAADVADFTTLREKLSVTDGTLSVHLRKLEEVSVSSKASAAVIL